MRHRALAITQSLPTNLYGLIIKVDARSVIKWTVPDTAAQYCDERVCLCVCLSVRDHIFGTTHPIFTKFFARVTCGRGSVLLWRRGDTLCTSGFMDDVMFAHKPRLLDVAAHLKRTAHAALGLAVS